MSDTIPSQEKQDLIEVMARALAALAHQHILGGARWARWKLDAQAAIATIEAAGYRIVRPHDWHESGRWVGDPMARMACRRCGVKDGEVPLSADCEG